MARLAREVRLKQSRAATPSMIMIDAQTARGGRAGPTFHNAGGRGGRTIGTKRTILVEILGLPVGVRVDPAKPHDVRAGRELLRESLVGFQRLQAIVAGRGYRGLAKLAARRQLVLDIKAKPKGPARLQADRSALSGRARLRPAWSLATPGTLLRGQRGERESVAGGGVGGLPTGTHLAPYCASV